MKSSKEDIWNQIKQDKSEIYGKPIFDIFIQIAELSLDHYKQLNEEQKNLAAKENLLRLAARSGDVEAIKDLIIRESRRYPEKNLVTIVLGNSQNKEMAEKLLIENKKLNWHEIQEILEISKNLKRTINLLGDQNISILKNNLTHSASVSNFLYNIEDKKKMVEALGHEILDKLDADAVVSFIFWSKDKHGSYAMIRNKKEEQKERIDLLGRSNVQKAFKEKYKFNELFKSVYWDLEEAIQYFGVDVLEVLDHNNTSKLIDMANDKDQVIKSIIENKNNLGSHLMVVMITKSENKNDIIELLGKERIRKIEKSSSLSKGDVYYTIEYNKKNLDKMGLFFKYISSEQIEYLMRELSQSLEYRIVSKLIVDNRSLSQQEVFYILYYAYHAYQKQLIELLGDENIRKLDDDHKRKIMARAAAGGGKSHIDELKELLGYNSQT